MFQRIAPITKNLIIINVLFFLATLVMQSTNTLDLTRYLGAFYPLSDNFKSYQILSHMFMHGGVSHLFFNMFALYMFGSNIEIALGEKRYLILYFVSGLGAYALFNLTNYWEATSIINAHHFTSSDLQAFTSLPPMTAIPDFPTLSSIYSVPMVGASGAIFGVLIAFAMLYPNAMLMMIFPPIPMKAKYFIGFYILIEIYLAVQANPGDNVAHYAHIGGALLGFILMKMWTKK